MLREVRIKNSHLWQLKNVHQLENIGHSDLIVSVCSQCTSVLLFYLCSYAFTKTDFFLLQGHGMMVEKYP